MSDGAQHTQSSSLMTADDGMTAVLAHSMLGTVAAIRAAIDTAMALELVGPGRDSVLLLGLRRLEFLTAQLRDLAAGVPGSAIVVDLRTFSERGSGNSPS